MTTMVASVGDVKTRRQGHNVLTTSWTAPDKVGEQEIKKMYKGNSFSGVGRPLDSRR